MSPPAKRKKLIFSEEFKVVVGADGAFPVTAGFKGDILTAARKPTNIHGLEGHSDKVFRFLPQGVQRRLEGKRDQDY